MWNWAAIAFELLTLWAVVKWDQPKKPERTPWIFGFNGVLQKIWRSLCSYAHPLTAQFYKDNFGWSSETSRAFELLKAMTQARVLAMSNFQLTSFVLHDASGLHGVWAVLIQEQQPIASFSRMLGPRAQAKSVYEKVLMSRQALVICIDQQSLRFIMHQREVWSDNSDYHCCICKLIG